jgi:hypothetical protein
VRTLSRPGFEWPPLERLPEHVRAAIAAQEDYERGGRGLTAAEVEALVELTAWAFNGVAPDHPQFEERFAAWCREATERHAQRLLRVPR